MGSWVLGAVLLTIGVVWIALRVTIERKAVTGSWLSHLIRELAVIRRLPVIGLIWQLLPLLLIAAGIIWLAGVRPPGMSGGESGSEGGSGTLCGDASSRPAAIAEAAWESYECRGESEAGERWSECLGRSRYTDQAGRGCPGAERCCPP